MFMLQGIASKFEIPDFKCHPNAENDKGPDKDVCWPVQLHGYRVLLDNSRQFSYGS